jgi:hypothetical protein
MNRWLTKSEQWQRAASKITPPCDLRAQLQGLSAVEITARLQREADLISARFRNGNKRLVSDADSALGQQKNIVSTEGQRVDKVRKRRGF